MTVITGILALSGAALVLLAGIGVVRFGDLYSRMHAATKATTLGVALVGAAGGVSLSEGRAKILLSVVVIFITTPVGAHFVGRGAYRASGVDLRIDAEDHLAQAIDDGEDT